MQDKKIITLLLNKAGININGSQPFDIQIHNPKFYQRVLSHGSLGLGESYMDGWWDCERLDIFFHKILSANIASSLKKNWIILARLAAQSILFMGRRVRAFKIGEHHYDIGNDLYKAMLDSRLTYTCGYWKDAHNLEQAQEAKLDLTCRKIGLKSGQTILDIGSGWGSFIGYAADKYKVNAVGITVSKKQKELSNKLYSHLPVETRLADYRDVRGTFDHVVSLGMFEHVGRHSYRHFIKIVHKLLKNNGLFMLHTIGSNRSVIMTDPWIEKYIFPGSMLPSIKQISHAIEGYFIIEDLHNFGADYDKTLMAWYSNFTNHWQDLQKNYDNKFYRMWSYYLLACAGSFRARKNQLWQIVLSKKGVPGGYQSIR